MRCPSSILLLVLAASTACLAAGLGGTQVADPDSGSPGLADLPDRGGPVVRDVADPRLVADLVRATSEPGGTAIRGRLRQVSSRPAPPRSGLDRVEEWFVETDDGRMVAVAVPILPTDATSVRGAGREGRRVSLLARPIGTMEAVARSGTPSNWPLLIGRPVADADPLGPGLLVVIATVLLAGGWFMIRRRLVSARPGRLEVATRADVEGGEPPMDLPEDPAEALSVLETRARHPERES